MIPLRDEGSHNTFPYVTIAIISANVLVYLYQAMVGPLGHEGYVMKFGLIPSEWTGTMAVADPLRAAPPVSLFTSIFMHGGILHILGNMWFLWIFADNIEDALGHKRFLIFYFVTGALATLAHIVANPSSESPLIGASGAVAGVLGGYFLLFPHHRILTLVPIFIFIRVMHLPAAIFLGFWFLFQVLYSMGGGNVAWWAHIGGFLSGMALIFFFVKRRPRRSGRY